MRKTLLWAIMLFTHSAHAGLLNMIEDVAREVSPEASKALDVWDKEEQRQRDELEEVKQKAEQERLAKEHQKALEEKEKLAEIKQREAERRIKQEQSYKHQVEKARYEAEKAKYEAHKREVESEDAKRKANEQERRIAELEAKLQQAEQRAEKETSTPQEPVETPTKPHPTSKEIHKTVDALDLPKKYAKSTLMMKSHTLDASYHDYMNFSEWLTRLRGQSDIQKIWLEGGTFTNLKVHVKRTGKPSGTFVFHEDTGEVYLQGIETAKNSVFPNDPQLKARMDYISLTLD